MNVKRLIVVIVALVVVVGGVLFLLRDRPLLNKEEMEEIVKSAPDYGYAWSQIFGTGTGIIIKEEQSFEWIAFSNSDGLFQFLVNIPLGHIKEEIVFVDEKLFRLRVITALKRRRFASTWFSLDNSWAIQEAQNSDSINHGKILEFYLQELKKYIPFEIELQIDDSDSPPFSLPV